jgi:DNA helicase-2/ATP-dependent DNA helicase PcrA
VDEYQDSNNLQQWLIVNLSKNAKVIAVGDEDQCIYTWRGANPDYMTSQFEHDFPGTKKFKFSYTFRYGHQIALFANHIIVNNINRTDKLCVSPDNKSYINLVYSDDHGDDLIPHLNLNEETTILLREYNHGDDVELYLLKHEIKSDDWCVFSKILW